MDCSSHYICSGKETKMNLFQRAKRMVYSLAGKSAYIVCFTLLKLISDSNRWSTMSSDELYLDLHQRTCISGLQVPSMPTSKFH